MVALCNQIDEERTVALSTKLHAVWPVVGDEEMASEAITQALDMLYEAAVIPDAWSGALHRFARATGSVGCCFYPQDPKVTDLRFPASPDEGDMLTDFFHGGWYRIDHRASRGWPLVESGRAVILEHDIASDDERRRWPYYQEFLKRHDLPWWAAIGFTVDGQPWCVPIHRSARQGAFTPDEARDLAEAAAGLRRVVSLAGKFSLACARSAVEALEQVGSAALALDRRGRCVTMNALARSLMGGDLRMTDNRLHALDRDSDQRLQRLIDCGAASRTPGSSAPSPVFVRRREGRPYMVEALPATGPMRDVFQRIAALLVVTDLDQRPPPPDGLIRDAFGLTPAEARLASTLGAGEDLHRAAEIHSMAYETARQHLKAIFSKTDVRRQSELVALLAKISSGRGKAPQSGRDYRNYGDGVDGAPTASNAPRWCCRNNI
jgi:DNA-binding CsgD family transcriptional regulator